jgi:glucoamylase
VDAVLKRDLPEGPGWRRYNFDGYGQKEDGSAYDGTGIGRCWPLLTGERGHYELAAGRDPLPYLKSLKNFANDGDMLPEQVWDDPDLPEAHMTLGGATGSAMPLCWAHAEYLELARSRKDGAVFECIAPVRERYAEKQTLSRFEIWTLAHQPGRLRQGKKLRIITELAMTVRWSSDGWKTVTDSVATQTNLGCWFADLPVDGLASGSKILFTLRWPDKWEGRDFSVEIS